MSKLSLTKWIGLAGCVAALVWTSEASAQWGTIKGQVVLDGDVPPPVMAQVTKDPQVCGPMAPTQELLVDSSTKGIANVFVYLQKAPAKIAPDLAKPKEAVIKFDQKNCVFVPHALVVRADQQVQVVSSDPIAHNTHTNPFRNQPANFILAPNDQTGVKVSFRSPERLPMKVNCDIHPWMVAWWLIIDHPYGAVTDEQGNFTIENLPAGKHEFIVWHEKAGYLDRSYTVTVESGKTVDLKPIVVPASKLKK